MLEKSSLVNFNLWSLASKHYCSQIVVFLLIIRESRKLNAKTKIAKTIAIFQKSS